MVPTVLHPFSGEDLRCGTGLSALADALRLPLLDRATFYLGVDEISHDLLMEVVVSMPTGEVLSSGVRTVFLYSDAWAAAEYETRRLKLAHERDQREYDMSGWDVGYAFEPLIELMEQQNLWGLLIGLVVQVAASVAGFVSAADLLRMSTTHGPSTTDEFGRRIANPRPTPKTENGAAIDDDDLLPF